MALTIDRTDVLTSEIRTDGEHALVALAGEVDLSTVGPLYQLFADLSRDRVRHVALNLAEVVFLDSTGLSVLVAEHKRVDSMGGELIIFAPRINVRRLFEVTGLDSYFNIRPLKGIGTQGSYTAVHDVDPRQTGPPAHPTLCA
jgi:anti-sigma B factor antagonist